jgi:NADH-quinone oxidoreductase subunit J
MTLFDISFFFFEFIIFIFALILSFGENNKSIVNLLCLISIFLSTSILLLILDFTYLALIYILVYVGGFMILFIFLLLLVNSRNDVYKFSFNKLQLTFISFLAFEKAFFFFFPVCVPYLMTFEFTVLKKIMAKQYLLEVITGLLYNVYNDALILVSIVLLIAMVGSINIALKSFE